MENTQSTAKTPKLKLDFKDSKYATGRRKTSIAKVWLKKGSGKIYVNGKLFSDYFADETHKMQITRPFEIINQATDYDVRCSVKGGGPTGQAGAMVHGISKALVLFDDKFNNEGPPYGANFEEYKKLFKDRFLLKTFEKCYNSIPSRSSNEFFLIAKKNI